MRRPLILTAAGLLVALLLPAAAHATFPFRPLTTGDVYDYSRYKITNGSCTPPFPTGTRPADSDLPNNFDCKSDFKLTSYAPQPGDGDYDPLVTGNPQELNGVKGASTNLAWEVTTGRPDVVIAVHDSGIRWDEDRGNLVNKFFLNRGELPPPGGTGRGGTLVAYDANADGVFNVKDYATDARAIDLGGDSNTFLDPSDLIRTFSDGVDDDGNGYVDDISGWDFFEGDNDPNDDVDYGHGTGESEDSAGETETNLDPQCPNCMLLEMRVGDSFVADVNHFAEGVIYAVDSGASVIQSALGTLNNTALAQQAVDYAYTHGVVFMASQADESAGHHNMPSALNHTLLANSVTRYLDRAGPAGPQNPKTYLAFNGCTNFGSYSWITVASTSCSSDAIAQSSGMAGLLYSAAKNAVQAGTIAQRADTAGRPLSAEEAKQLFRLGADDVDFSTPKPPAPAPPNNFATSLPDSQRFVTTANWDQITGWGRINANKMVRLVQAGTIPPEADITSPRWWQTLDPARTAQVPVIGQAAAPRLATGQTFSYKVQYAAGVQAGCPGGCVTGSPTAASDTWIDVGAGGTGLTAPVTGTLATLNMAAVRAEIDRVNLQKPPYNPANDPTSRELPEKDAFRVRVLTCVGTCPATPDYDPKVAIEQRQYFARVDAELLPGFPKFLDGDGASSAAFDDIDGDNVDEMVIADGNGYVHAFKADGSEAAGWPARTTKIGLPITGDNAYTRGDVPDDVHSPVLAGSPAVADLDGDGSPEIMAADMEGRLWAWSSTGVLRPGFPVRTNPAYSEEPGCQVGPRPACDDYSANDVRDEVNTSDRAFTANPAVGDLDPGTPGLEIVAGANDGHVYAWHASGAPVAGWPVLLRDPAKVQSIDPVTHKITHVTGSGVTFEKKVITAPSLADLDGDGKLEVLSSVNEQYAEEPNQSGFRDPSNAAVAQIADPGNTRVYALHRDGALHPPTGAQETTPHIHDQAYVSGWPVPIAVLQLELLPYVGIGSNGAPVAADVNGDGKKEVFTASIASAPYLLNANGSSFYGNGPDGKYLTMASQASENKGPGSDFPSFASLGGGAVGKLTGAAPGAQLSFAMGATGLRRLLDVILPEQQLGAEDHIGVWNASSGTYDPGFPQQVNDLMFFNTPAIADVTGDGNAEVLQSTATYDLQAYGAAGVRPATFPKHTGGWSVGVPGLGDLDGDGKMEVALPTREGNLFVWKTNGLACQAQEWPKFQGNLRNTGAYGVDAKRPGKPTNLTLSGSSLSFKVSGDDGACGQATAYHITRNGTQIAPGFAPTGPTTTATLPPGSFAPGDVLGVQGEDEVGNRGFRATLVVPAPPVTVPTTLAPGGGGGGGAETQGYRLAAADGGVFAFGVSPSKGSAAGLPLEDPVVAMAETPSGNGYWLVARDGGIFAFGDAPFKGSMGGKPLNQPIVGMAATKTGQGYWLVARDGGVFAFGDAVFLGSMGGSRLNRPIVGMARTAAGTGYRLVASDGGVFSYNAPFLGSTGSMRLNQPVVGMGPAPSGDGYWLVARDGGIFSYGVPFHGSTGSISLNQPIVGMAPEAGGRGYWLAAADGGIFAFEASRFLGSLGATRINSPVVGITAR